jgi:hypothetical protein
MPHKEVTGYPSVTQVINVLDKPGLCMWYGKLGTAECNKIKNEAAKFGTHVHTLIEHELTVAALPLDFEPTPEELACVTNFIEWYKTSNLTPISMEPEDAVISKTYGYQGTWDFIGRKDGTILVADWKTSNQLYDTVGLQLAAYAQLYGESQGWTRQHIWRTIPNGLAVRIDKKTAKVYTKVYTDLVFYFDVFESLLLPYQFASRTGAWSREKNSDAE